MKRLASIVGIGLTIAALIAAMGFALNTPVIYVIGAINTTGFDNVSSVIRQPTEWHAVSMRWMRFTPLRRPASALIEVYPPNLRSEWRAGSNTILLTPIMNGVCRVRFKGFGGSSDLDYRVKVELP